MWYARNRVLRCLWPASLDISEEMRGCEGEGAGACAEKNGAGTFEPLKDRTSHGLYELGLKHIVVVEHAL